MIFEYEAINICIMLIMKIKYYVTEYFNDFIFRDKRNCIRTNELTCLAVVEPLEPGGVDP